MLEDNDAQTVNAFLELSTDLKHADVMSWCSARLADFKVPKKVTSVENMPRTAVDTIDRMALGKLLAQS